MEKISNENNNQKKAEVTISGYMLTLRERLQNKEHYKRECLRDQFIKTT